MKIAVIDSGIYPDHPHISRAVRGVGISMEGITEDFLDCVGHGTAVAAAILEKAPDAEIYAVKVFDGRLSANIEIILRALQWCVEQQVDLINLSLGTTNPAHRERFERVLSPRSLVVAAAHFLPGSLPGVIGVAPEPDCPRDIYRYRNGIFYASPYPRPIPGVPPERNLSGASFAVANMTGLAARVSANREPEAIQAALVAGATPEHRGLETG